MCFAVDDSVAVKRLAVEEDADIAQEPATICQDLHAPCLMVSEVANALQRKAWMGIPVAGVRNRTEHGQAPHFR